MRILSNLPDAPPDYAVTTQCVFCDDFHQQFLLLEVDGSIAAICIECIHQIAVEALKRFGDRPISRA